MILFLGIREMFKCSASGVAVAGYSGMFVCVLFNMVIQ